MATQQPIDWSRDVSLPVHGKTSRVRHAGATGAQVAARDRGALALAYRDLLLVQGPLSDHEAARILGRLHTSMNSTRSAWGEHVVESGEYERTDFGSKRTRWRWVDVESRG